MFQITRITNDYKQSQTLGLPNGKQLYVSIFYIESLASWYFKELRYENFKVYNVRIGVNDNVLRQYKGVLPFGISCTSKEPRDPFFIDDFSSGLFSLFILNQQELIALG